MIETPHMRHWCPTQHPSDAVIALLIACISAYSVAYYFSPDPQAFVENGPVENMQLILLGASLAMLAPVLRRARTHLAEIWFLVLMVFTITVREIDVRGTVFEPLLGGFFAVKGQWLVVAAAWLAYLARFRAAARQALATLAHWCRTPSGWLMLGADVIYMAVHARFVDRRHEETLETFATLMILIAAIRLFTHRDGLAE